MVDNKLSISTIKSDYPYLNKICDIVFSDDVATALVQNGDTWTVGPPQGVVSISCKARATKSTEDRYD